jgi:hypothetical protein
MCLSTLPSHSANLDERPQAYEIVDPGAKGNACAVQRRLMTVVRVDADAPRSIVWVAGEVPGLNSMSIEPWDDAGLPKQTPPTRVVGQATKP